MSATDHFESQVVEARTPSRDDPDRTVQVLSDSVAVTLGQRHVVWLGDRDGVVGSVTMRSDPPLCPAGF